MPSLSLRFWFTGVEGWRGHILNSFLKTWFSVYWLQADPCAWMLSRMSREMTRGTADAFVGQIYGGGQADRRVPSCQRTRPHLGARNHRQKFPDAPMWAGRAKQARCTSGRDGLGRKGGVGRRSAWLPCG